MFVGEEKNFMNTIEFWRDTLCWLSDFFWVVHKWQFIIIIIIIIIISLEQEQVAIDVN